MATLREKLEWEVFKIKKSYLFDKGIKSGLIHCYEQSVANNLRKYYYGHMPLSLMILSNKLCSGKCFTVAPLVCFGFLEDDFKIVTADVDGIRLNPELIDENNGLENPDPHFAFHRFVERTLSDGSVWVYDTTDGLVYEKGLYYRLEKPRIINVSAKEELEKSDYRVVFSSTLDDVKRHGFWMIPALERIISEERMYKKAMQQELDLLKEAIGYVAPIMDMEPQENLSLERLKK